MPKILLTGFEPFAGERINPAQAIVNALHGKRMSGHRIVGVVLPTQFAGTLQRLESLLKKHQPSLILALGQAGGRNGISLERIAINLIDARIPDNLGEQPVDVRIVDNAPNAYFSTLPIKAMLARLTVAEIAAAISHSAGTFVCNQVFYALAHLTALQFPSIRSGFIHVPYLPQQAKRHPGAASMRLNTMVAAVTLCVRTALERADDLHYSAGTTH